MIGGVPVATILQYLVYGLQLGSVYALLALGYTMVYGIVGMINFAHGDFLMIGALAPILLLNFSPAIRLMEHSQCLL